MFLRCKVRQLFIVLTGGLLLVLVTQHAPRSMFHHGLNKSRNPVKNARSSSEEDQILHDILAVKRAQYEDDDDLAFKEAPIVLWWTTADGSTSGDSPFDGHLKECHGGHRCYFTQDRQMREHPMIRSLELFSNALLL